MDQDGPRKRRRLVPPTPGAYVLRNILEDIPLRSEDTPEHVSITCVEHWNNNLYIGTSASEILHLVGLPAENENDPPLYILASRLQPTGYASASSIPDPGVQQIIVLPGPSKACVLCNGTVSFYSLPELSPAFSNRDTTGVQWIGGIDENSDKENPEGSVLMVAISKKMLQVRVGDKLRAVKPNIEYPGCLGASRRDTIACVADENGYALLEIEHQQKIPLFSISTAPEPEEVPSVQPLPAKQSVSGHSRSTSLFTLPSTPFGRDTSPDKKSLRPPDPGYRPSSPGQNERSDSRPSSRPRSSTEGNSQPTSRRPSEMGQKLKPHILSPTPEEFMLTTGTTEVEAGVGMFVNLDGEVVRGTLEFEKYPEALLSYDFRQQENSLGDSIDDLVIIAMFEKSLGGEKQRGLEFQVLSETGGEKAAPKSWVSVPSKDNPGTKRGLHLSLSGHKHVFSEVADLLKLVCLKLNQRITHANESDPRTASSIKRVEQESALFEGQSGASSPNPEYEQKRNDEELKFVQRLCNAESRAMVWSGDELWQILKNPLLLQLENDLLKTDVVKGEKYSFERLNISTVLSFIGRIRDREPNAESEFLALTYARQKASILLFLHLLSVIQSATNLDATCKLVDRALHEGNLDPRIPLLLIFPLAREVLQGRDGIWISQGIMDCLDDFSSPIFKFEDAPIEFWRMIWHYLITWQEKRGFGSIADEKLVFDSVDSALLLLLLHLDSTLPPGSGIQTSARAKLQNIVDNWKGSFDRAVILLERYHRLYILSRLHQSRKAYKDVLATWKRICEGAENAGNDISIEGIQVQMRKYLPNRTDPTLVKEYGLWLAKHNPELAVQVFADDSSRVKFAPTEIVSMLKEEAPGAVQMYLEHLVFAKGLQQYADDLVGYYLDSVLNVLESSEEARQSLSDSYSTYRALTSPKPTYLNFITQNTPADAWWQSRLRLLQLLGSGGYASGNDSGRELTYSIEKVLDRLKPFSAYLVSESIILDARQGRHEEALQLLVHGLGDYDTALRYCYFGGPAPVSRTIDASLLPSPAVQKTLFAHLYIEFLSIEDEEDRLERTSHLLGTFANWFDPVTIIRSVPDHWTVALLSEFLTRSLRAVTSARNEAVILKALSAAQNLQKQVEFIEVCEKMGAKIEEERGRSKGDKHQGENGNGSVGVLTSPTQDDIDAMVS